MAEPNWDGDFKVCPRCNCWVARPTEWEPLKARLEIERLTKERDEWKAKWEAMAAASLIAGTLTLRG